MELRRESDALFKQYNLSVLKEYEAETIKDFYNINEKSKSKKYHQTEIGSEQKYVLWKNVIKEDIDEIIQKNESFENFIFLMKKIGYEVKNENVMHIAFKAPGQKKFTMGESILT